MRTIKYPEPSKNEIIAICKDIRNKIFNENYDDIFSAENAGYLGDFMLNLNKFITKVFIYISKILKLICKFKV